MCASILQPFVSMNVHDQARGNQSASRKAHIQSELGNLVCVDSRLSTTALSRRGWTMEIWLWWSPTWSSQICSSMAHLAMACWSASGSRQEQMPGPHLCFGGRSACRTAAMLSAKQSQAKSWSDAIENQACCCLALGKSFQVHFKNDPSLTGLYSSLTDSFHFLRVTI